MSIRALLARLRPAPPAPSSSTGAAPLRGRVSRVSVLPRGKVSVVLHFDLEDGDRARGLTPDTVIEVAEVRLK